MIGFVPFGRSVQRRHKHKPAGVAVASTRRGVPTLGANLPDVGCRNSTTFLTAMPFSFAPAHLFEFAAILPPTQPIDNLMNFEARFVAEASASGHKEDPDRR